MAYGRYEAMLPGLGAAPGFRPMIVLTPEHYSRLVMTQNPSQWPYLFLSYAIGHGLQEIVLAAISKGYVDSIKAAVPGLLGRETMGGFEVALEQSVAGPEGDARALCKDIERYNEGLLDNWKSGIGVGMGFALSGAMDSMLNVGQMIYAYKTLAYHTAITPRMRRHWNRLYTPMVPDAQMAWMLYRRGTFTRAQFEEHAAYDGWSKAGTALLAETMMAVPTPDEAFYLWCRNLLTETERNQWYWAGGWEPDWWSRFTEGMYYVPSIYDLTRIADYVELDQIWALDVMKRRGVREADRAKMWEMLELRPIRDEMRAITSKWLWAFKLGRCTLDELKAALVKLRLKTKERDLLTEKAVLDYEHELIDEWIEILRWRFRTAAPLPGGSEESFKDELLNLGIREEKANLIVELEKAKGYYGYY